MKVALLCTEKLPVPPIRGGAIQAYIDGVAPLLARSAAVTVICCADPDLPRAEERDGVRYVRLTGSNRTGYYYRAAAERLQRDPHDVVVVYNRPRVIPFVAAATPDSRLVLSLHNEMFAPDKLTPAQAAYILDHTARVVTVSDWVGKTVARVVPAAVAKLRTIYSGVDLTRFRPCWDPEARAERRELRRQLGLTGQRVLLFVGRLSEKKGAHVLLRALGRLAAQHPDVTLLVVGSKWFGGDDPRDPYVMQLKRFAQRNLRGRVRFTGWVPFTDVHRYYWAADLFVWAYRGPRRSGRGPTQALLRAGANDPAWEGAADLAVEEHPAYPEELGRLRRTVAAAEAAFRRVAGTSALTREGEDLFEESMHATRAAEEVLEGHRLAVLRQLGQARRQPYFGRIDFQADDQPEGETFYLGKAALADPDTGQPLVIDWRAPVAAVFYTGAGADDRAAYEAPGGRITGSLTLKRHLYIRRGVLRHIADSHVSGGGGGGGVGDAHLLYALQESRDHRLRELVATIQAEQNALIRAPADQPLLIQGAAGSGKTSVALHRVAYLLYMHQRTMAPERVLIFAPNRLFLDYIADVLPELGLSGIRQTTFDEWALAQLHPRPPLVDSAAELDRRFQPGRAGGAPATGAAGPGDASAAGAAGPGAASANSPAAAARHRRSLAFLAELDAALAHYATAGLPRAGLELWPGARLPAAQVAGWYHDEYRDWPLNRRRRRVLARLRRWARRQADAFAGTDEERPRRLLALLAVRRYARSWPRHSALSLYRAVTGLAPGPVSPADLAPLVYLQERLEGSREDRELDHVVIDEGQEVSPLQVALLRRLTRGDSFTILGDLAQGINADTALEDWQELMAAFPPGSVRYHELSVSYRATYPIARFAQHVLGHLSGTTPPQPVHRPGPPVRMGPRLTDGLRDPLAVAVRELQQREYASIAVVGRNAATCDRLQAGLAAEGLRARRISAGDERYAGGLSVIPAYLTKGLEFDAVVVADAGPDSYPDTRQDARLLYVVLTRALHELVVFHPGEPSPLLADMPADRYAPLAADHVYGSLHSLRRP